MIDALDAFGPAYERLDALAQVFGALASEVGAAGSFEAYRFPLIETFRQYRRRRRLRRSARAASRWPPPRPRSSPAAAPAAAFRAPGCSPAAVLSVRGAGRLGRRDLLQSGVRA